MFLVDNSSLLLKISSPVYKLFLQPLTDEALSQDAASSSRMCVDFPSKCAENSLLRFSALIHSYAKSLKEVNLFFFFLQQRIVILLLILLGCTYTGDYPAALGNTHTNFSDKQRLGSENLFNYASWKADAICFIKRMCVRNIRTHGWPELESLTALHARHPSKKGAKAHNRYRPKKSRPSSINARPPPYLTDLRNYQGAPPEYSALPVDEVTDLLQSSNGRLFELLTALNGIPDCEAIEKLKTDSLLYEDIEKIRNIAETQNDEVSLKIVNHLKMSLETGGKAPSLNPLHNINEIEKKWDSYQTLRYTKLLLRKFRELLELAHNMMALGSAPEEFLKAETWKKYGLFEDLPKSVFVDRYLMKHADFGKYSVNDIASGQPLDQSLYEAFKGMGVLKPDNVTVDVEAIYKLLEDDETARKLTSLKDIYLRDKYSDYEPLKDAFELEKYVEAEYRSYTLKTDLEGMYKRWLERGSLPVSPEDGRHGGREYLPEGLSDALPEDPKDKQVTTHEKNSVLSAWRKLPRSTRKELLYRYKLNRPKREGGLGLTEDSSRGDSQASSTPDIQSYKPPLYLSWKPQTSSKLPSLSLPPHKAERCLSNTRHSRLKLAGKGEMNSAEPENAVASFPDKQEEDRASTFLSSQLKPEDLVITEEEQRWISEPDVSDGTEEVEKFPPRAELVVYDDPAYDRDEFITTISRVLEQKLTTEDAARVWNNMKVMGKVIIAKFEGMDRAENLALMLRHGNPQIWADAEDIYDRL